jgi:hypothetical protein
MLMVAVGSFETMVNINQTTYHHIKRRYKFRCGLLDDALLTELRCEDSFFIVHWKSTEENQMHSPTIPKFMMGCSRDENCVLISQDCSLVPTADPNTIS